jgi:hypothetical protein
MNDEFRDLMERLAVLMDTVQIPFLVAMVDAEGVDVMTNMTREALRELDLVDLAGYRKAAMSDDFPVHTRN